MPITISMGLTEMGTVRDPFLFIKAADDALYRAKNGGRNRIEEG